MEAHPVHQGRTPDAMSSDSGGGSEGGHEVGAAEVAREADDQATVEDPWKGDTREMAAESHEGVHIHEAEGHYVGHHVVGGEDRCETAGDHHVVGCEAVGDRGEEAPPEDHEAEAHRDKTRGDPHRAEVEAHHGRAVEGRHGNQGDRLETEGIRAREEEHGEEAPRDPRAEAKRGWVERSEVVVAIVVGPAVEASGGLLREDTAGCWGQWGEAWLGHWSRWPVVVAVVVLAGAYQLAPLQVSY